MLGTAMLVLLAMPAEAAVTAAATPGAAEMSCRDMAMSSSRLDRVKVCKSTEEWRRWDLCHTSIPRDCSPKKKTVRVAGLEPSAKLICKTFKETASRLGQRRFCATKREWELSEFEAQDMMRDRQNRSTLTGGSEDLTIPTRGPQ